MMEYRYVFLLGRPGCGKSALYRELERRLLDSGQARTFERADDFPKLWARFQKDDALEREGKPRIYTRRTTDGLYRITDFSILDEILQEVSSDVVGIDRAGHVVFIEFARPRYVEALRNFDSSILERCLVVYMEVSLETCWNRNVARHEAVGSQDGDDHMVGREAMEAIFLHDDQQALVKHLKERGTPVLVVNNEANGEEHLGRQVDELLARLLSSHDRRRENQLVE
jgi:hypothetical protein